MMLLILLLVLQQFIKYTGHCTYRTVEECVGLVINVDNSASSRISEQLPYPNDCCSGGRGHSGAVIQFTHK